MSPSLGEATPPLVPRLGDDPVLSHAALPLPADAAGDNAASAPVEVQFVEVAPQTDEEWAEALKFYGTDRPSEFAAAPSDPPVLPDGRRRGAGPPLGYAMGALNDLEVNGDDDLERDVSFGQWRQGANPQFRWEPSTARDTAPASSTSSIPSSPAADETDGHWPPPRVPDSFSVVGSPRDELPTSAAGGPGRKPSLDLLTPQTEPSAFSKQYRGTDSIGLPRQVNPSEDSGKLSAEAERARLREFYERDGWLPAPTPSRSTRHRRASALCRLGLSGKEDSGPLSAVISKYCDLLSLMFDTDRAGLTIFRGDEETVYLSNERKYFTFEGDKALSAHGILHPEYRCWVCSDMTKDWRFKKNPTVLQENAPHGESPVFFACAPLRYHRPDGDTVDFGALIVTDSTPREFGPREQAMLLRLSNMLVFQFATLQSEIMAKRSGAMYESSINFIRRSFIPDSRKSGQRSNEDKDKDKRRASKKRHARLSNHHQSQNSTMHHVQPRHMLHSPQPSSAHPSSAHPSPSTTPPTPPVRATKTGPRDAKRAKRRGSEAEELLFNDAAHTLRGILQADAVAMVDLHEFQLFVRKTASSHSSQTVPSKESIIADSLQGKEWPANVEPVVNFVPRYSNQAVDVLGQSCGGDLQFDFSSPSVPQVLREFVKTYLVKKRYWWDREDQSDDLALRFMSFMPNQGQTMLATPFMTYTGSLRYAIIAVWSRPPSTFDDSSRLAIPFVWVIGAALLSSLAIVRVRAIEESQITYSNLQAHELRTPLHQILAITQLLRSSISEFAEAPVSTQESGLTTLQQVRDLLPLLDAIDTSGTTLRGIVENILTFLDLSAHDNRWVGGNPTVGNRTNDPTTLSAMFEELIHEAYEEDRRGRVGSGQALGHIETIFEVIPPDLGELVTEDYGGALRRALARVIHNAYRYIEVQGCVEITVDDVKSSLPPEGCEGLATTRRILITVADNGRGMSAEFVREKLGEPWAKEDLYATGSGLSVHLAYRIIDLMNGEMEITSAPGAGCTVTIDVPVPVAHSRPPPFVPAARKIALIGFDPTTNQAPFETHCELLGDSLERQYRKLGCEIVDVSEAEVVIADGSLEDCPTGLSILAGLTAPEVVILAARPEDENKIAAAMSSPSRRVRRLLKPVTPSLIRQTVAQSTCSAPPTPTEAVAMEALRSRRPHFDAAAMARPGGPPAHSGPTWNRGVCVEDAVASLSLGDYFSSRNRVSRPSSSGGSTASSGCLEPESSHSESGPQTGSTESSVVESGDSHLWNGGHSSGSPATTPEDEHHGDHVTESNCTPILTTPPKIKVLVVEDNVINRKILVKILKAALPHLEILEAEDGVDAVERFREFGTPAIVLLDINMPRMDGYAAALEMRMIERQRAAAANPNNNCATPTWRSKIIAVTALSGEDEKHRGLVECGMDQWLTKPCPKSTLQKVVDEARNELSVWDY